ASRGRKRQGKPIGLREDEDGGSEGRLVMRRIGVHTPRESGQSAIWCLVTRKADQPTKEAKQRTAVATYAGAASRCKAHRHQISIVKVMYTRDRVLSRAFRDA